MDWVTPALFISIVSTSCTVASFIIAQRTATKRNSKEQIEMALNSQRDMQKLTSSIEKLNMNFESMLEADKQRDERIKKHGSEIDMQRDKRIENEKQLANHETRIKALENWRDKNF